VGASYGCIGARGRVHESPEPALGDMSSRLKPSSSEAQFGPGRLSESRVALMCSTVVVAEPDEATRSEFRLHPELPGVRDHDVEACLHTRAGVLRPYSVDGSSSHMAALGDAAGRGDEYFPPSPGRIRDAGTAWHGPRRGQRLITAIQRSDPVGGVFRLRTRPYDR